MKDEDGRSLVAPGMLFSLSLGRPLHSAASHCAFLPTIMLRSHTATRTIIQTQTRALHTVGSLSLRRARSGRPS